MLWKAVVCEDDPVQNRNLGRMVCGWGETQGLELQISSCTDCISFQEVWRKEKDFNLILLDIDLGQGINGMELAEQIRRENESTAIVFVTGLSEYMSRGYDVQALHFLVKPVEKERLWSVLDRALKMVEKKEAFLLLQEEGRLERIPVGRILYAEAFSHTSALCLSPEKPGGKVLSREVRMNLGDLEKELPSHCFLRCHRSYLVNLGNIRRIEKNRVFLEGVLPVPVSRERRRALFQEFLEYHKGSISQ